MLGFFIAGDKYQLALKFWQAVDRTDKLSVAAEAIWQRNITFSSVCLARKIPIGIMHSGMKFSKKIVADLIKKDECIHETLFQTPFNSFSCEF